jgi:hypothetical protein
VVTTLMEFGLSVSIHFPPSDGVPERQSEKNATPVVGGGLVVSAGGGVGVVSGGVTTSGTVSTPTPTGGEGGTGAGGGGTGVVIVMLFAEVTHAETVSGPSARTRDVTVHELPGAGRAVHRRSLVI